jgi:REP element-mobilizing transposase RayT
MTTYRQILYQIVFSTKRRERIMIKEQRERLHHYIVQILQNKKCHPYRVNGVEDHIHIITDLNPDISLSSLVKDIKLATTVFIKEEKLFTGFNGWQEGYGAFTYSIDSKKNLIHYVENQEEHHARKTFKEEYLEMLEKNEVVFDVRYFP